MILRFVLKKYVINISKLLIEDANKKSLKIPKRDT
jgi:hypothetical protein